MVRSFLLFPTLSVYLLSGLFTSVFLPSEGCDPGMYPCPANSNSTQSGAPVCPCFEGYYRADGDPPEMECTRKSYIVVPSWDQYSYITAKNT